MTVKPCLDCHRPTRNGSRCPTCGQQHKARREAARVRGTRQERGYTNDWYRIVAQAIREQPYCSICGEPARPNDPLTGGHIIPRSKGGPSTRENCQPEHLSCNSSKGNR